MLKHSISLGNVVTVELIGTLSRIKMEMIICSQNVVYS